MQLIIWISSQLMQFWTWTSSHNWATQSGLLFSSYVISSCKRPYLCRTANKSCRTYVFVKQMPSNPIQLPYGTYFKVKPPMKTRISWLTLNRFENFMVSGITSIHTMISSLDTHGPIVTIEHLCGAWTTSVPTLERFDVEWYPTFPNVVQWNLSITTT